MLIKAFISIGSSMILAGCTFVTPPLERPVIEKTSHDWFKVPKTAVYSTTASRRQVIINFPSHKVCAEAPPDVAESLVSELALRLAKQPKFALGDSDINLQNIESADSQVEIAKSLEAVVENLFDRTQGAQYFRDGAFHLCLAYMNDAMSKATFVELYNSLQKESSNLIETELKANIRKLQVVEHLKEARISLKKAITTKEKATKTLETARNAANDADSDHKIAVVNIEDPAFNESQRENAIKEAIALGGSAKAFAEAYKAEKIATKAVTVATEAVAEVEQAAIDEMLAAQFLRDAIEKANIGVTKAKMAVETME